MEKIDIIIGNVKDEIHNIAKTILVKEIEKIGLNALDLGISVPVEKFVEKVKETDVKILVLTGLLNSAPEYMRQISKKLREEGIRNDVKILIGGPNVNEDWLKRSEADAIANNISEGLEILHSWKEGLNT